MAGGSGKAGLAVQPVGPPLGVPLPKPTVGLGACPPAVLGTLVGLVAPVGADVGPVDGVVGPVEGVVVGGVEGVLDVESGVCGVDGVVLGELPPEPEGVGEGESGFCDGVELLSEPFPPGF